MSVPERGASALGRPLADGFRRSSAPPPIAGGHPRRLCGWGRTAPSSAIVFRPKAPEEVAKAFAAASRSGGLIARGAGRSYGDAAQNAGGVVADLTELGEIKLIDGGKLVRAGAGATLAALLGALAPRGLTLPVLPGTRHATLGGAIAADVHGKNHRRDGSFGHHVQSMLLCAPEGGLRELSRERERELFEATLGGMGLTGVIVEATLRPEPLGAPLLDGDIDRVASIEEALAVMAPETGHRYAIAWIDLLSGGSAFGRAVVLRSNERPLGAAGGDGRGGAGGHGPGAPPAERAGAPPARFSLPGRPRLRVPEGFPQWVLGALTVRAYNTLRWRRAPQQARGVPVGRGENLFPLDALGDWNRLYGRGGLLQYQFAVPEGERETLVAVVRRLQEARQPMYLAVVKRFGAASGGLLSFPAPGWTLAVDLPAASPGLHAALDAADELVAQAGGRVYLAKDARLRAEMLRLMYPQLDRFCEVRAAVDPEGVLRSDMARRLGLLAGGRA